MQINSFELYFDESGNFEDLPLILEDGVARERAQPGASQLVGFVAPAGLATPFFSEGILGTAHRAAGLSIGRECHATDLLREGRVAEYGVLLESILRQLPVSGLQPVRLCNGSRFGFGDKVATYTCMVAELVVRIFETLTLTYGGGISLNITAALVVLNGNDSGASAIFIDEKEYKSRLNEQITFAAVRRGVAHNRLHWSISGLCFRSARKDRRLQLCDILSNASYHNFKNAPAQQKRELKHLLGRYDFLLNRADVLEEIAHHSRDGSLAHAIQAVAANWNRPELQPDVRQTIAASCPMLVARLVAMPPGLRNLQLRQLAEWGSQFLEVRDLDLAERILCWLQEWVAEPLLNEIADPASDDAVWFLAQILMLRLGELNHHGDLAAARPLSDRLQSIFPVLAGRWEHGALITEAMTLRAVHLNDCCEYDAASRIMGTVADFYGGLSSLMADALPGIFPERVHSRQRGMALGTQMQSEMLAGLVDPARLDVARGLNEQAMEEFGNGADQQRQYQYRCQLEAYAGKLADARYWLAQSLGIDKDSHAGIAEAVSSLEGAGEGFALLHWSRIAVEAARRGDKVESARFREAFAGAGFWTSRWVTDPNGDYPAHGIRRHLAVSHAAAGEMVASRKAVAALHALHTKGKGALTLMKFAGVVEALSWWEKEHAAELRKILRKRPSLLQEIRSTIESHNDFPGFSATAKKLAGLWSDADSSLVADRGLIARVCRLVGQ